MKRAYYYLFYKLYKHYEDSSTPWWSDFKASVSIGILEIWLLLSTLNYFLLTTGKKIGELTLQQPLVFIPIVILFLLHYFSFIHTDIWKKFNQEFDQLPTEKNKVGSIIVWSVIIVIVVNMIFSYYLLYERAKRNQTGPYSKEYIQQQKIKDSLEIEQYKKRMEDIKEGK